MAYKNILDDPDYGFSRCLSVAEAEAENMVCDKRLGDKPIPFGFGNKRWLELLEQMHTGDELWEFCSPQEFWDKGMGSAGIALIRNGQIVAIHTSKMN